MSIKNIEKRCGDTICQRDIDERTLTNNVSYSSSDDSVDAHLTPFRRLARKYEQRYGCSKCKYYIFYHEPKRWAEIEREAGA